MTSSKTKFALWFARWSMNQSDNENRATGTLIGPRLMDGLNFSKRDVAYKSPWSIFV